MTAIAPGATALAVTGAGELDAALPAAPAVGGTILDPAFDAG